MTVDELVEKANDYWVEEQADGYFLLRMPEETDPPGAPPRRWALGCDVMVNDILATLIRAEAVR